jgi:hypothetical protein
VACYVEVIGGGAYDDGTPYSILVQAAGGSLAQYTADATWELRLGVPFGVSRLTKDASVVAMVPAGVLLPQDFTDYGVWGGFLLPISLETSVTGQAWVANMHSLHQSVGETRWTADGIVWPGPDGAAAYERPLHWTHLTWRTGAVKWMHRGLQGLENWFTTYHQASGYAATPWRMHIDSCFMAYHLTGASQYADAFTIWLTTKISSAGNPQGTLWTSSFAEGRPVARFWSAALAIHLIGSTSKPGWWSGTIAELCDAYALAMDDVQGVDGGMNYPDYGPADKFFMSGMMMYVGAMHMLRRGTNTATIQASMVAWCGYLWGFAIDTGHANGGYALPYCDAVGGTDCSDGPPGSTELNGFYLEPFFLLYALTGNTTHRDRGDLLARAMSTNGGSSSEPFFGSKQYNEVFHRYASALRWRGGATSWP